MKFQITKHGGQFQFWHMDCDKSTHESPMNPTKCLTDGVQEFKCVACKRVGQVTLPEIIVGSGELEVIN